MLLPVALLQPPPLAVPVLLGLLRLLPWLGPRSMHQRGRERVRALTACNCSSSSSVTRVP
jgi:hypothetical protein